MDSWVSLFSQLQSKPGTLTERENRSTKCWPWAQEDAPKDKDKLYEVYPKLKEGGGFELLRSGSTANELVRIKPPMAGYSVPFLRDVSGLSQALAYIRPLQKKLSMEVVEEPEVQVLRNYLPF